MIQSDVDDVTIGTHVVQIRWRCQNPASMLSGVRPVAASNAASNASPAASESIRPEALPAPAEPAPLQPESSPNLSDNIDQYSFDGPLGIFLVDEPEFCGGTSVQLKILVMRATTDGRQPAAKVKVVVKTLSTAFSPGKVEASTDEGGLATISLKFPKFRSGRAAVLVQAERDGTRVELGA